MERLIENGNKIRSYIQENRERFEETLLNEAVNVREKIDEIQQRGNINLVSNAHLLIRFIVEKEDAELIAFARQEGEAWAKHSLTLGFKIEWIQAIRRTLWMFLRECHHTELELNDTDEFFETESLINDQVDNFLHAFFIRYSEYKDQLLEAQKQLVVNLSVPVIPLTSEICVLPLIGAIDSERIYSLEEKILTEIGTLRISKLILDLSGVADIEEDALEHVFRLMNGITMMGCEIVVTGLRPEIIQKIIKLGHSFNKFAETKGTLQQALQKYMKT
ncbi:STAS domain-containing protein [Alteribacillus sp. HJP-4]|uniref:STAS domain-containing protein n=1 Tax=Alteribacillus sp. HJP-4 TaxID=2775394 RepID=UPI0035CD266B